MYCLMYCLKYVFRYVLKYSLTNSGIVEFLRKEKGRGEGKGERKEGGDTVGWHGMVVGGGER